MRVMIDIPDELYRQVKARIWLDGWDESGRRIAESPQDPRTTREILLSDRR